MFHFCVSKVLTVERVTNKTKPSFMQIFVYLTSSNHRLESAGLNALEELFLMCALF